MKMLEEQIASIEQQIRDLQMKRQALLDYRAAVNGEPEQAAPKKRVSNVKPLILDLMKAIGAKGANSTQVFEQARALNPAVAKETVSSVLSRLKADGALNRDGDVYFDVRFTTERTASPWNSIN